MSHTGIDIVRTLSFDDDSPFVHYTQEREREREREGGRGRLADSVRERERSYKAGSLWSGSSWDV